MAGRQTKDRQQLNVYRKLNIDRNMHIEIKFIAMCTAYDFTDLAYITNLNLNPRTLKKKNLM